MIHSRVQKCIAACLIISQLALISCTPATGRIINGEDTNDSNYRYHARVTANSGNAVRNGGGVFVSQQHVLTVASLISGFTSWQIGYGSPQLASLNISTATTALVHPQYDASNFVNDIGIITLSAPIVSMVPILPQTDHSFPGNGVVGNAYGFGYTSLDNTLPETLQRTRMTVISYDHCGDFLGEEENWATETHFCAADAGFTSAVCEGDIGGPVEELTGMLMGLLSVMVTPCDPMFPVVYTRTSMYYEWVYSNVYGSVMN